MTDNTVTVSCSPDGEENKPENTEYRKGKITTTVEEVDDGFAVNINLDGDFSGKAFLIAATEVVCIAAKETGIPIEMFVMKILGRYKEEYDSSASE